MVGDCMEPPAARLRLWDRPSWQASGVAALATVLVTLAFAILAAPVRLADVARLDAFGHGTSPAARLARGLVELAAHPDALHVVVAVAQAGCVVAVALAAWRISGSGGGAAVAALVIAASPLAAAWLGQATGVIDAIACGLLALALGGLFTTANERLRDTAAGGSVLFAGFPAVAVAAAGVALRGRGAALLIAAAAAALLLRFAAGVPANQLLGDLDLHGARALVALRLLVFAVASVPALLFLFTRRFARRWSPPRSDLAVAAAAAALALVAGFAARPAVPLFGAEIALVLLAARHAVRLAADRRAGAAALAVAGLLVVGGAVAWPRAASSGNAERDRAAVLSAGRSATITIAGAGDAARERYSPQVIAFLAGRPVDVRYEARVAPAHTGPVFVVTAHGLERIDSQLHVLDALGKARAAMRYDLLAHAASGRINDTAPRSTPSGRGVIPSMAVAGPSGTVGSIVVLSGFSWTFERVPVRPGDRLVYAVAKATEVGFAAGAAVTIEIPGRQPVTVTDEAPPETAPGLPDWRLRSVALPLRGPAQVRIRFAASSPSGRNLADWVAFAEPAIVSAP